MSGAGTDIGQHPIHLPLPPVGCCRAWPATMPSPAPTSSHSTRRRAFYRRAPSTSRSETASVQIPVQRHLTPVTEGETRGRARISLHAPPTWMSRSSEAVAYADPAGRPCPCGSITAGLHGRADAGLGAAIPRGAGTGAARARPGAGGLDGRSGFGTGCGSQVSRREHGPGTPRAPRLLSLIHI